MQVYTVTITDEGTEIWRNEKGQYHREGGKPAYIGNDGYMAYWKNDKRHRIDGPAKICPKGHWIYSNGLEEYWIDDIEYTKEDFLKKTSHAKEMTVAEIEKALGYYVKIVK